MKSIKKNLNLIIGLLTVLFVGFIIYNSFFSSDEVDNGIQEVVIGEMDPSTRRIIEVLDKIDNIKIDASFFNQQPKGDGYSLTFNELEDFSQPIPNKRPRKVNPFVRGGAINYLDEVQEEENEENTVVEEVVEEQ
jgi:hypothetical protein